VRALNGKRLSTSTTRSSVTWSSSPIRVSLQSWMKLASMLGELLMRYFATILLFDILYSVKFLLNGAMANRFCKSNRFVTGLSWNCDTIHSNIRLPKVTPPPYNLKF